MVKFKHYLVGGDIYNCTKDELGMLEKEIGIVFPNTYRHVLLHDAGKDTDPEEVTMYFNGKENSIPFGYFLHGKNSEDDKIDSFHGVFKNWVDIQDELGRDDVVPFAKEGGGNGVFAFKNNHTAEPPVVYFEWDDVDENEIPIVHKIASSFDEFLKLFV